MGRVVSPFIQLPSYYFVVFCWGVGLLVLPVCFVAKSTQVFCESMQELFTYKRIYDRQGFVLDRRWRTKKLVVVILVVVVVVVVVVVICPSESQP